MPVTADLLRWCRSLAGCPIVRSSRSRAWPRRPTMPSATPWSAWVLPATRSSSSSRSRPGRAGRDDPAGARARGLPRRDLAGRRQHPNRDGDSARTDPRLHHRARGLPRSDRTDAGLQTRYPERADAADPGDRRRAPRLASGSDQPARSRAAEFAHGLRLLDEPRRGAPRRGSSRRRPWSTFSVPDGRAANQPCSVTTLRPPIGAPLPGAVVRIA